MTGERAAAAPPILPARNALISATQVFVTTLVAFATYAFVSRTIGIDALGIWSVTLAICALVSIADLGVGGSLVRFLASYRAEGSLEAARTTAVTAIVFVLAMVGLATVLGYFAVGYLVDRLVPESELRSAHALVPFALLTAAINSTNETVLGGLEGCERYGLRAAAVMLGSLMLIGTTVLALPVLGAVGLGIAFVVQSLSVLGLSLAFLARALSLDTAGIPTPSLAALRPLLSMGWRFKTMGMVNLLLEPVTKVLVLRAGGSEMSGLFEMTARLPAQLRALLVAAMQVTVPRFASLGRDDRHHLYRRLSSLALLAGCASFATLVLALPFLSQVLIGRVDATFALFACLMSVAWLVNVQSAPAYFAYMGMGELRWNLVGHFTMGLLNVVLGYAGGKLAGAAGVVAGACLAITLGSSIPTIAYGISTAVWPKLERRADWLVILGCAGAGLAGGMMALGVADVSGRTILSAASAATFAVTAALFLLRHPALADLRPGSADP